ncbi:Adenine nucleotide alpha hydrolases-like superfamily [Zostera marina]|uniref:Adenine nucleotide alpha hydrolases-like superfamily n=1 Tax=Zostera marina TaxID=29655 RepID=A0A0K9NM26_ZOSMR|nr:Adenine nucleotide alpha hydrolases-like superfamily [Zostera marina]
MGVRRMVVMKKRVMVVMDEICSSRARHTMMWALTHVVNKGDILTLVNVVSPYDNGDSSFVPELLNSLGSLCKASRPEVEVEVLVIQGSKLPTILTQVKKLEVSVLVLTKRNPSLFSFCGLLRSRDDEFVEQCINNAECLTLAITKQNKGVGGYLISTRWHKNFWLLA